MSDFSSRLFPKASTWYVSSCPIRIPGPGIEPRPQHWKCRVLTTGPRGKSLCCIFYLFIFYFWLCWVFISVRGLSLVVASGGHSSSRCAGLSLLRPLLLRSTGSRRAGSVAVAHGLSCSAACGIFPDQGPNPCPLHWQADSQPLRHQGSPLLHFWLFPFIRFLRLRTWKINMQK